MVRRAKTFLITSEKHELVIVRAGNRQGTRDYCAQCMTEVDQLSFDDATKISGLSGRELVRLIDAGKVHSFDRSEGRFSVCMRSLETEKENAGKTS